jgi:hypothetical protein
VVIEPRAVSLLAPRQLIPSLSAQAAARVAVQTVAAEVPVSSPASQATVAVAARGQATTPQPGRGDREAGPEARPVSYRVRQELLVRVIPVAARRDRQPTEVLAAVGQAQRVVRPP